MNKIDLERLRELLTADAYDVTQKNGTERPFKNAFWDHKDEGIYVDVVSGAALFSSLDKFDSGTGWPSFSKPLNESNVDFKEDRKLFMTRTEVRSKDSDSHLGHVFNDGPKSTGKRYCINSAALEFIPKQALGALGYGEYESLFEINERYEAVYLGGGCFWGIQHLFDGLPGVEITDVGYAGGEVEYPTYREVCTESTGHAEVARVVFNPQVISFQEILSAFFRMHDPTQVNRQGVDVGSQYRSCIFTTNNDQLEHATSIIEKMNEERKFPSPVVTSVSEFRNFYKASPDHQKYFDKNPHRQVCHILRPE